ncbi:MAG: hypothetical protein FWH33_09075 [Oscillospiraceae bacterium]|nr:hypothetical protein [Oscillospiraceae bacterium]
MTEIISVRFNNRGKAYFFDPSGLTVNKGDNVVVETAKGLEYGECTNANHSVNDDMIVKPLRPVVRVATETDKQNALLGKERERDAFLYCQDKIAELGLEMKLVDVEYGFEGSKILFFFTSEGRVDFRELVKDLAGVFRSRIELRQIGVRDEAKMIGGLGNCGKPFCCSQFLTEFHPVSIKMAKVQGLSLNPTKISGTCGRLMCCLKYEEAAYEELVKKAPKVDAFVETPSGKGTVVNVNLLRRSAKVRLEDDIDTTLKTFTFDEIGILGGKGRRAEYIAAKAEGRLTEAGFTASPIQAPKTMSSLSAKPPFDARSGSSSQRQTTAQHQSAAPRQAASQHQSAESTPTDEQSPQQASAQHPTAHQTPATLPRQSNPQKPNTHQNAPQQANAFKNADRRDQRPAPDQKKKQYSPAGERYPKADDRNIKSQQQYDSSTKKQYHKRYKGGYDKNR